MHVMLESVGVVEEALELKGDMIAELRGILGVGFFFVH
jgi:hypothetical protein